MFKKLKEKAKQLKKDVLAIYLAARHKDTPLFAKIMATLVAAYALSPIDLIPDFIPVLGYLDDIILLPLGILLVIKLIPEDVMQQCKKQAEEMEGKPKSYAAAIAIILIWAAIIALIVLKILGIL